ncbi:MULTISPECIES: sensor histidine kinase [Streptomyces]|uniref:histidine kinase n=2 Tax=Streptomyces TaxID=1883 RepID=A0A1D8G1H3_9ACTN|nr:MULTISPECIES: histidine kinase [Streptomyces]AOT59312.1 Sensor histidine kinase DesK [Streptomyces rubrolavendulae]KAF0647019.1 histidine kinase [Streptomyces fradiae ATCC 10745 = DSM 40063]OSY54163.1 Sensor histidine kinase DesK [Streptomyces fradiae ATCC 10745 = DSM 40063]QEV12591.1 two-component sensor histidine kinase [Streptomyces fradiae ATCC 10745 = DSM 40063]
MTTTGAHQDAAGTTARGFGWWERRRAAALDIGLGALSAVECAAEGADFAEGAQLPPSAGLVFGLLAGSVLAVRRRRPIAVVLVSIAVTPAEMGYLMAVVGLYTLAASEVPRRITAALAGTSLVAVFLVTFVRLRQDVAAADFDAGAWYVPLLSVFMAVGLTAPPVLLGLYIGARRRLMESLRERADSLEQELSLLADQAEQRAQLARTEERTRIAREMHDVVAHRVSLMVVHAAALQAVAPKDPQKAVRNAALVGEMGRQALTELREMLGVLRADPAPVSASSSGASSAASSGAAPSSPQGEPLAAVGRAAASAARRHGSAAEDGPGLDGVEELVEQSRATGTAVELLVRGEPRAYAPEVGQTAYRVVQEALTNVHKHAAGAEVVVRLAHREEEVAMQVENGPSDAAATSARLPSGGNGLVGMRERVTALGGVFVSGPTEDGGFRVSAVLPAPGPAAGAAPGAAPADG